MSIPGSQFTGRPSRTRPHMMATVVKNLQGFLAIGDDEWRVKLATVGLTPEQLADPDGPIPQPKGFAAMEAAARWAANPSLCIDYAAAFEVGGTGALGFATISAKNVREALRTISRFMSLVASLNICRYEETEASGAIIWQYPPVPEPRHLQYVLWGCALVMQRIAPALPPGWKPHAVAIDLPPPANAAPLKTYFGRGLRFAQPLNRFEVQAEHLDRALPSPNPRLFDLMTRLAEFERKRRGVCGSEFEADARHALAALLHDDRATIQDLAETLAVTPPELRKVLKLHQLDFRGLLDDVRKSAAETYLLDTSLSITEIAFALGYSDSSIFTRACHKWFGKSPRDVRTTALVR